MLFIDESGDHSLKKIDPSYPVFVLGGVIVEKNYADNELTLEMDKFKQKIFGTTNIILHAAEICRNRNKFLCLKNKDFRAFFYQELNDLMRRLQYKVIACVIHKNNHLHNYGAAVLDPYMLSLDILLERFGFDIPYNKQGLVIAEKRNNTLDNQLKIA